MRQPKTPECNKMARVRNKSQIIGEFIEWLNTQGYAICKLTDKEIAVWNPVRISTEQLLADYFGVDLNKVEFEKRQMLKYVRSKEV